ncbi:MAG: cytochrome c oxidase subunit 1, partial [Myxococcota bacterium]
RYHSYDHLSAPLQSALQTWHQASTVGAMLLGFGLLVALVNLVVSLFNGKKAPADPWGGATLEWTHAASPPDVHNFEVRPQVTFGPYDFVSRFERGDHDVD